MSADLELFRRSFIAAVASTLAACTPREGTTHPASRSRTRTRTTKKAAKSTTTLDTDTVAAAERVLGVEYTPAERTQMLQTLQQQIDLAKLRRSQSLPNGLAPATLFDPRLPGAKLRVAKDRLRLPAPPRTAPAGDDDIAFASLPELAAWLRAGHVSSTGLTTLYLKRLERLGPALQCTVTLTRERALAQARKADLELAAGRDRGPLHGIPWGAKDILDTANIRTTWGAEPFRDRVPEADAAVVRKLDEAGAVLVAKLTTGALAYGDIWFGGRTRNPWNLREGSSGSSAGPAAAVAAGLCAFAIGTETLGSIVSPSMRCGTTGLRPTYGRVARTGCMALCWSLDKIGPITRFVDDAAIVLATIHGRDDGDPGSRTLPFEFDAKRSAKGLRVGIVDAWMAGDASNEVDRAALEALRRTGVELVPVEIPKLPTAPLVSTLVVEAAATFEALTLDNRDDELAWQTADAWPNIFRAARFVSAVDLVNADRWRRQLMIAFDRTFANVDAIFGPSFADSMLLATNFTGHPSLTLRAGFVDRPPEPDPDGKTADDQSKSSCPHGVTLLAVEIDEHDVVGIARHHPDRAAPRRANARHIRVGAPEHAREQAEEVQLAVTARIEDVEPAVVAARLGSDPHPAAEILPVGDHRERERQLARHVVVEDERDALVAMLEQAPQRAHEVRAAMPEDPRRATGDVDHLPRESDARLVEERAQQRLPVARHEPRHAVVDAMRACVDDRIRLRRDAAPTEVALEIGSRAACDDGELDVGKAVVTARVDEAGEDLVRRPVAADRHDHVGAAFERRASEHRRVPRPFGAHERDLVVRRREPPLDLSQPMLHAPARRRRIPNAHDPLHDPRR